jgi:predicted RNase H-like HicB family nuclease
MIFKSRISPLVGKMGMKVVSEGRARLGRVWIEKRGQRQQMDNPLLVHAKWDHEACVWVATSDDVPGLATEAETLEELTAKLERMVPELLEANNVPINGEVSFELLARRFSVARLEHAS